MGYAAQAFRTGRAALGLIAALCLSGVASAQDLFQPPAGCTLYLTAQNRSCVVEHYYRCPDIDPDHQWRASFGADGPHGVARIDGQAQWVSSGPANAPEQTGTLTPIRDAASLDTLLAEGYDDFDFFQRRIGRPFEQITGFDRITGKTEIDGEPLFTTEFKVEQRDWQGRLLAVDEGQQYVSATHRRFFGGVQSRTPTGQKPERFDYTPVEFFYPGEPGFASTVPLYDCGLFSGAPASEDAS